MGDINITSTFKDKLLQQFYNVHIQLEGDNSKKKDYFMAKGWIFTAFMAVVVGYMYYLQYDGWAPTALGAFYGALGGYSSVYIYHNGWKAALKEAWDSFSQIEINQDFNDMKNIDFSIN